MWEAIGRKQSAAPAPRPIRVQDDEGFFEIARFTPPPERCAVGLPPLGGRRTVVNGLHIRSACGQADFLFFLSSSTSVNSASTTSSFLASAPVSVPPPAGCSAEIG